jgi:hypothetical protein
VPVIGALAESTTPLGSAAGDIVTYILGFGPLGIGIVLFALRIIVPGKNVDDAVKTARADLVAENERLIEEKRRVEAQRDEATKVAQEKIVPLLTTFLSTTGALLPLLQAMVSREHDDQHRGYRRRGGD